MAAANSWRRFKILFENLFYQIIESGYFFLSSSVCPDPVPVTKPLCLQSALFPLAGIQLLQECSEELPLIVAAQSELLAGGTEAPEPSTEPTLQLEKHFCGHAKKPRR